MKLTRISIDGPGGMYFSPRPFRNYYAWMLGKFAQLSNKGTLRKGGFSAFLAVF